MEEQRFLKDSESKFSSRICSGTSQDTVECPPLVDLIGHHSIHCRRLISNIVCRMELKYIVRCAVVLLSTKFKISL
jgi:hypothetical protein